MINIQRMKHFKSWEKVKQLERILNTPDPSPEKVKYWYIDKNDFICIYNPQTKKTTVCIGEDI